MTMASQKGTERPSLSVAITAAAKAITEATERSISPAMMTKVIITAMIAFSIDSSNRFTKLSMPR